VLQRFVAKLLHDVMKNSDKVDSLDLRFIIAHLLPPVLDYWTAFLECMPAAHQPPHADLYPMEMEIDADVVYMQYILVSVIDWHACSLVRGVCHGEVHSFLRTGSP